MASKRKRLTIKEKVDVINVAESEKLSLRDLAQKFGISKNQVSNVLKDKEEIRRLWITNSNENNKTVKFRKTGSSDIDTVVFNWFSSVRTKNIPVSGVLLQEKAKEVAESLGLHEFKASNGWLDKFKQRHNITFKTVCGEEKSVDMEIVTDWIKKLNEICEGYEDRNIYNADETGLFYRIMPNKTLCFKGEKCSGGKCSKERLTVLLCSNMKGEFEQPLVIGKAKNPRCFKHINPKTLSVYWYYNKKSWMTQSIMSEWLIALDKTISKQKRKILLFLDNSRTHPPNMKLKSVKLVFFPPNTTSVLQPLDQGVIRCFKLHYRKMFLRHVLCQADSGNSDQLAKSVNVMNAIQWITKAINSISQSCVQHCFKKAGFEIPVSNVLCENTTTTDENELSELVKMSGSSQMQEYIDIDANLSTEDSNDDIKSFISTVVEDVSFNNLESSEEDEDEPDENCDIKNYTDALKYASQLKQFMINVGDSEGFKIISDFNMHVGKNACNGQTFKQTRVTDYFQ